MQGRGRAGAREEQGRHGEVLEEERVHGGVKRRRMRSR
jgi:hypothetical protein